MLTRMPYVSSSRMIEDFTSADMACARHLTVAFRQPYCKCFGIAAQVL